MRRSEEDQSGVEEQGRYIDVLRVYWDLLVLALRSNDARFISLLRRRASASSTYRRSFNKSLWWSAFRCRISRGDDSYLRLRLAHLESVLDHPRDDWILKGRQDQNCENAAVAVAYATSGLARGGGE